MDAQAILKRLMVMRDGLLVLTDPKLIEATQGAGHESLEAKRRTTVKKSMIHIQNLLFAYEMVTTPVKEPKRTLAL